MTAVAVVRHGNTFEEGVASRRIGSPTDLPLVDEGRRQAERLAALFPATGLDFRAILSSRSRRCVETARLIAAGLPVLTVDWLSEIDHGPDENKVEAEVLARLGADAIAGWNLTGTAPDDWVVNPKKRIDAWRQFFRSVDTPTLLITSNGAARFALLAAGIDRGAAGLTLRTGAYGLLDVSPGGHVALRCWDVRPRP